MKLKLTMLGGALFCFAGAAHAQFAASGGTDLKLNIAAEASLSITDTSTTLSNTAGIFGSDFTGSTAFLYKIRTSKTGGTGTIQLRVSQDFGAGGPSVYNPPTAGDALTYTCTVATPATPCSGSMTSAQTATGVATFGADAKSVKAGNSGSVSWNLTNDPVYSTGSYQATVTFTISAT